MRQIEVMLSFSQRKMLHIGQKPSLCIIAYSASLEVYPSKCEKRIGSQLAATQGDISEKIQAADLETRAEIINADASLLYRGMDIGTAKPSEADTSEIQAQTAVAPLEEIGFRLPERERTENEWKDPDDDPKATSSKEKPS